MAYDKPERGTYAKALVDHAHLLESEEDMQTRITQNEWERLY